MSSNGSTKFKKYFEDRVVQTTIKEDTQLFGVDGSILYELSRGTLITVHGGTEYTPKVVVQHSSTRGEVRLSAIEKPIHLNRTIKFALKPDKLGIAGEYNFKDFAAVIKHAIKNHPEIPSHLSEYLISLVDVARGAKVQVKLFDKVKCDNALLNSVDNDFMEVLGPFFVAKEFPEFKDSVVNFPIDGNEPLYDFSMTTGVSGARLFSSKKSKGKVNTLKAPVVYDRVITKKALCKKYNREFDILRIIKTCKTKEAADALNEYLAETFTDYKKAPASTDAKTFVDLERAVVEFINKSDLNFTPLVKAALPNVSYVRSSTDQDGSPLLKSITTGTQIQRAQFRSKSSHGHISDKLGFDLC